MWLYRLTDNDVDELVCRMQGSSAQTIRLWLRRLEGSEYVENEPEPCTNDDHFIYGRHFQELHSEGI